MKVLVYLHWDGCKDPAFIVLKRPNPMDTVASGNARHLDGSRFTDAYGTLVVCDSCKQGIFLPMRVQHIVERELPLTEIAP